MTASPMKSTRVPSTVSMRGARTTIALGDAEHGDGCGMARPGFTSVCSVPRHSPPSSFTAPISVMLLSAVFEPVVSKSMTQNDVAQRGAEIVEARLHRGGPGERWSRTPVLANGCSRASSRCCLRGAAGPGVGTSARVGRFWACRPTSPTPTPPAPAVPLPPGSLRSVSVTAVPVATRPAST